MATAHECRHPQTQQDEELGCTVCIDCGEVLDSSVGGGGLDFRTSKYSGGDGDGTGASATGSMWISSKKVLPSPAALVASRAKNQRKKLQQQRQRQLLLQKSLGKKDDDRELLLLDHHLTSPAPSCNGDEDNEDDGEDRQDEEDRHRQKGCFRARLWSFHLEGKNSSFPIHCFGSPSDDHAGVT